MKKIVASFALIALSIACVFAQQEELESAASNIEKQDYITALDDISKAKKKVNDLITEQLAAVLPAKFGEFELSDSKDMGYGMEGQGVSMNKTYRKPAPKKEGADNADDGSGEMDMDMGMGGGSEPMIQVKITTNMMMANDVMSAHSMSEEGMEMGMSGVNTEAYRVKGYRAISKVSVDQGEVSQEQMDMGMMQQKIDEAQAIAGGAFIMVSVMNGEGEAQAKAFMELIDFDKLIGIVGK